MNKKIDPSNKDCAYCERSGAKLMCAKCKAAHYCSKACQKLHWKNGHKGMCIAPEKRQPQAPSMKPTEPASETAKSNELSECPICLEFLSQSTLCTLPCQHDFHRECVKDLRKHGVLQACPLCRTALPAGPEKLNEDATRNFVALTRKVESGKASWLSLTAPQKKLMAEAVAMWTTAANQGHAGAQYNLGVMYATGDGVSQDHEEALWWTRKAADQGYAGAQFNLGVMYATGDGVSQDHEEALWWTRKAADQGHVAAQFNLGIIYRDGRGISRNLEQAAQWFQKAAHQGHAGAQYNLGFVYNTGGGVSQDFVEAARWTRKAAGQGHAEAQFNLAIYYWNGQGVPRDFEEAARWAEKAAAQGSAGAKRFLIDRGL